MSTDGEGRSSSSNRNSESFSWLAMACFVEGLEPSTLALSQRHLIHVEAELAALRAEPDTLTYYRCLDALSKMSSEGEVI